MHILLLPSSYPTPMRPIRGSFFREQAHALKRARHRVGVIAVVPQSLREINNNPRDLISKFVTEDDSGIPTYRFESYNWLPLIPYGLDKLCTSMGLRLFKNYVDDQGKPDLIHAHSALFGGSIALEIKKRYGIPFVITEHSSSLGLGTIHSWQKSLAKNIFSLANARIVVSPALGESLEQHIGSEVQPWVWIPNIVNPIFQVPHKTVRKIKESFRFLNIAWLTENKGHRDLLCAFAASFRGKRNIQLRIGGDGPLLSQLIKLSEELGLSQQVVFLGQLSRDEVVAEMQQASIFVLPSHYETFGVVLIEALACGLPVLATACGGPEHIVTKENGILIHPHDLTALSDAMVYMYLNIASFDRNRIHNECINHFGEQVVLNQLNEIYDQIMS